MRMTPWKALSALLFASVSAWLAVAAFARTSIDWDVVPYTMAVLRSGGETDTELHARTWSALEQSLPPASFKALRETWPDHYFNVAPLADERPLYESKYGYILAARIVAPVVGPVRALALVSLLGALAVLAVLCRVSWDLEGMAVLIWLPIARLFELPYLANLPTPDAFAAGLFAVGFWAFLRSRLMLALPLFAAGVFVRPDNIVLVLALCAVLAQRRPHFAAWLLFGSAIALMTDVALGHPAAWWRHIHYTFVTRVNGADAGPFDLSAYVSIVARSLDELAHMTWPYVAAAIVLLSVPRLGKDTRMLVVALIGAGILRFAVYPSVEARLYAPLLFGLATIALLTSARHVRAAADVKVGKHAGHPHIGDAAAEVVDEHRGPDLGASVEQVGVVRRQ